MKFDEVFEPRVGASAGTQATMTVHKFTFYDKNYFS